jgi:hypothetical protein
MIQFIKKYQSQIGMGLAISVLVLCYFQRKEISRLRQELGLKQKINTTLMNIDKESNKILLDSIKK